MSASEVIVHSNNLHEVFSFFDDKGKLRDSGTRIRVRCQLCKKQLAITNEEMDIQEPGTHEAYAVLQCGHAFGAVCLSRWMMTDDRKFDQSANCPTCCAPISCENGHALKIGPCYLNYVAGHQAIDVQIIRHWLAEPSCAKCCLANFFATWREEGLTEEDDDTTSNKTTSDSSDNSSIKDSSVADDTLSNADDAREKDLPSKDSSSQPTQHPPRADRTIQARHHRRHQSQQDRRLRAYRPHRPADAMEAPLSARRGPRARRSAHRNLRRRLARMDKSLRILSSRFETAIQDIHYMKTMLGG
ncbi:hypothetical protein F4679DRAFT_593636 [Xylaria curta]|nr:hypothetical protein F4679DRAFT_593636 [Xylaria curta]